MSEKTTIATFDLHTVFRQTAAVEYDNDSGRTLVHLFQPCETDEDPLGPFLVGPVWNPDAEEWQFATEAAEYVLDVCQHLGGIDEDKLTDALRGVWHGGSAVVEVTAEEPEEHRYETVQVILSPAHVEFYVLDTFNDNKRVAGPFDKATAEQVEATLEDLNG